MASERSLIPYILLEEDCYNLETTLIVGNKKHGRLKEILGEKLEHPYHFFWLYRKQRCFYMKGEFKEHVLLTVNGRKLMQIYSSYTPCNLLESKRIV